MKECCEVRADVPERARRLSSRTDAIVYGFSLYAVARGAVWQARAARLKGLIMAAFGVVVLAQVVTKLQHGLQPNADTMGVVGSLALAANTVCWPDLLVGLMIAGMFCASATSVIRSAAARPA